MCRHLARTNCMRLRSPGRLMRLVAIVIIVVMLAVGYGFLLRQFDVSAMPMEQQFGIVGGEKPAAQIYIEALSIDALNDAMQMRVSLATSRAPRGQRPATPDRDLRLMITHDKTVEEIKIAANDHGLTNTFEVDLNDGSVADYPLDVYRSDLRVRLVEGVTRPDNPAELLPAKVTVWEGLLGFQLEPHEELGSAPGELWLSFKISSQRCLCPLRFCRLRRHDRARHQCARDRDIDVDRCRTAGGDADRRIGGNRVCIAGAAQCSARRAAPRGPPGYARLSVDRACGRLCPRSARL